MSVKSIVTTPLGRWVMTSADYDPGAADSTVAGLTVGVSRPRATRAPCGRTVQLQVPTTKGDVMKARLFTIYIAVTAIVAFVAPVAHAGGKFP